MSNGGGFRDGGFLGDGGAVIHRSYDTVLRLQPWLRPANNRMVSPVDLSSFVILVRWLCGSVDVIGACGGGCVLFEAKGLDLKDAIVLSGAHATGFAQCFTFKRRLFNFKGSGKPDPMLDSSFLSNLQSTSSHADASNRKITLLNSQSTYRFDNMYYKNLLKAFLNQIKLYLEIQRLLQWSRTIVWIHFSIQKISQL
ncbi:unnamed protein product [Fraxinus pennsylvanica]|uniref:peroxidase n=1 Tax=Fraxinus pennsylvanica TaxID=56036 RepID=A0AAD2DTT3_9LAMI|nr:unnamed protein product [Fraxinus pennsylvanica]